MTVDCAFFFCFLVGSQLRNLARKLVSSDHILVTCNGNVMTCDLRLQPKLAWHHLVAYNDNIATCNGNLVNCKGNLLRCHGIFVTCHLQWPLNGNLEICHPILVTCNGHLITWNGNLVTCNSNLITCHGISISNNSNWVICSGNLVLCKGNLPLYCCTLWWLFSKLHEQFSNLP